MIQRIASPNGCLRRSLSGLHERIGEAIGIPLIERSLRGTHTRTKRGRLFTEFVSRRLEAYAASRGAIHIARLMPCEPPSNANYARPVRRASPVNFDQILRMVPVAGVEPALLSELDFEVNRAFHRAKTHERRPFKRESKSRPTLLDNT